MVPTFLFLLPEAVVDLEELACPSGLVEQVSAVLAEVPGVVSVIDELAVVESTLVGLVLDALLCSLFSTVLFSLLNGLLCWNIMRPS